THYFRRRHDHVDAVPTCHTGRLHRDSLRPHVIGTESEYEQPIESGPATSPIESAEQPPAKFADRRPIQQLAPKPIQPKSPTDPTILRPVLFNPQRGRRSRPAKLIPSP